MEIHGTTAWNLRGRFLNPILHLIEAMAAMPVHIPHNGLPHSYPNATPTALRLLLRPELQPQVPLRLLVLQVPDLLATPAGASLWKNTIQTKTTPWHTRVTKIHPTSIPTTLRAIPPTS